MSNIKKRKKGAAMMLMAACIAVLGVGTCFAYPYIETVYSPKTQVLSSLKESAEASKQLVSGIFTELTDVLTEKTNADGNIVFTKAQLDKTDLLEKYGMERGAFKLHINAKERSVNGDITVQGSEKKKEAYVSVSEKDLKNFLEDNGYPDLYRKIHTVTDNVDSDTLKEYMQVSQKTVSYMSVGLQTTLQESLYEKMGKAALKINEQEISVVKYRVTVTKEALFAGIQDFLNKTYEDKELNSYTTMFATFTGYSKNDLQQYFERIFEDFTGLDIFVYLNKDKNAVRIDTSFNTGVCSVVMEMQGVEKLNEQISLMVKSERFEVNAVCESRQKKITANMNIRYNDEDTQPYGYTSLKFEKNGKSISCTEGEIKLKAENHSASAEFYGMCTYETE